MASTPTSPRAGRRSGRERFSVLFGVAISAVALAGCIIWASHQPAPSFPTSTRAILLLAGCLVVLTGSMLLRGFRWGEILHRADIDVRRSEPYALTVIGYMGNTVLPFRGGEALRVVLLKENSTASWPNSIGSIVPERALDLATLIVLLTVLVLSGVIETPGGATPALAAIGLLAVAVAAALVYRQLRRRGHLQGIADRVRPLAHASRLLLTPAGLWLGALSMLIWIFDGTIFFGVAKALSLSINPLEAIGLAVAAATFSAIPAGPAFAGTYDAALLFALGALEVSSPAAISFVLLVRFATFVPVTIAGLILLVARYGGLSRLTGVWRRRSAAEEAVATGAAAEAGPFREPAEGGAGADRAR